jgi:ankyrin repeat protein
LDSSSGSSSSCESSDSGYAGSGSQTERKTYKLDVDTPNKKCMNATALHLAVWNDHQEIAIRLVQAGADPNLKMNDMTALEMVKEAGNEVLHELLLEYSSMNKTRLTST